MKSGNFKGHEQKIGVLLPHQIPIAFFGIEFESKPADISLCISRAALSG
jgi:hypothetical protein